MDNSITVVFLKPTIFLSFHPVKVKRLLLSSPTVPYSQKSQHSLESWKQSYILMDMLVYAVPSNYPLHYFTKAAAKQGLAKPSLQFDNHMAIDHGLHMMFPSADGWMIIFDNCQEYPCAFGLHHRGLGLTVY